MPLSFPPLRMVLVHENNQVAPKWQATCRTCGEDVCREPQVVKAAVDEARRAHGPEKTCTRGGAS